MEIFRIEPPWRVDRIGEAVSGNGLRVVIQRLREGIGNLILEAVLHRLHKVYVQRVIRGVGSPIDVPNNPQRLVNFCGVSGEVEAGSASAG